MKQKITVTIKDGYNGKTAKLTAFARPDGKIYLTSSGNYFWSGAIVNEDLSGINQIALPLRRYVEGLEVEETNENDNWNSLLA